MSNDIAVSAATRASISAYRLLSDQIGVAQARIATGKRINSAFDNPAAFFISTALSSRASSLNGLMDDITTAKNALQAASNGVSAIRSLLASAQSAANSALLSPNTLVKVYGASAPVLAASTDIVSAGGSATQFKNGDTITVSDGTVTAVWTANSGGTDTVQDMINAINGTAEIKVQASLVSGRIELQATSTNNITLGGSFGGTGTLLSVVGLNTGTTTFTANATRTGFAQQYDSIRAQIDAAALDAGVNGLNLLAGGSTSLAFNETGSSSFTLTGATLSSLGLGLTASTGQFQTDADISAALSKITAALSALDASTATFSSNLSLIEARADFNQSMIDTLMDGADDLVLADTDAESATLLALQTRQKLAMTALSIASDADSLALRLFDAD